MRLFHGSNVRVDVIDLGRSKKYKDFGQAFYLSADESQAQELAESRADFMGGEPVVNEFEFDEQMARDLGLKVKRFEHYSLKQAIDVVYGSDTYAALTRPKTGLYNQSTGYVMQYLMQEIRTGRMG